MVGVIIHTHLRARRSGADEKLCAKTVLYSGAASVTVLRTTDDRSYYTTTTSIFDDEIDLYQFVGVNFENCVAVYVYNI